MCGFETNYLFNKLYIVLQGQETITYSQIGNSTESPTETENDLFFLTNYRVFGKYGFSS